MAQFVSDTFTESSDTNLDSHVGETGATWASFGPSATVDAAKDIIYGTLGYGVRYASGTPASADYSVTCVIEVPSGGTNSLRNSGPAGRVSTSVQTGYFFRLSASDWQLYKVVSGSFTSLGSWTDSISAPATRTAKLELSGSTITGYVDGTSRVSVTDTSITAAGKAGIWIDGDASSTSGAFISSISADDLVSGSAGPLIRGRLTYPSTLIGGRLILA
jgi:hypothetical protein